MSGQYADYSRGDLYTNVVSGADVKIYNYDGSALSAVAAGDDVPDLGVLTNAIDLAGLTVSINGVLGGTASATLSTLKLGMPIVFTSPAATYYVITTGTAPTVSATKGGATLTLSSARSASTGNVAVNPPVGDLLLRSLGKTIRTPAQSPLISSGNTNQVILRKCIIVKPATNAAASGTDAAPGEGDGPNSEPVYINLLDGSFASA